MFEPGYNSESCASPFQGKLVIRMYICTRLQFGQPLLSRSSNFPYSLRTRYVVCTDHVPSESVSQ
jgi:hypothetical protein